LTSHGVKHKGGDDAVYVKIDTGAPLARSLGGVVSIHAGEKANSIENISNREQFQQRIKYDITKAYVELMEIGQLKDIHAYHDKVFPETGLDKPLIIGSDCHDASKYAVRSVTWIRADPTFRGLLMTLREPRDRVFIGDRPLQAERIEQNPTKYIRSISFRRKDEAPATEHWFNGEVIFNLGLVAIIGNKGSGKSALSDSIGLLGSTRNADSFSFLCEERFCHPMAGHSQHYEATLKWVSGEAITRCLNETIGPDEIERLKYLPQNHVDKVCNELVELGESNFEQELGAVIFSHVPDAQRLGCASLAELIDFRNSEKVKRIDTLVSQLKEISRLRAELEAQNDPVFKRSLKKQLGQRELELQAHDQAKPVEVPNPSDTGAGDEKSKTLLTELSTVQSQKDVLTKQVEDHNAKLREAARRSAVAGRLIEMLDNFGKEFERFKESLRPDAEELGLKVEDMVALSIKRSVVEKIRSDSDKQQETAKTLLEDASATGLKAQLASAEAKVADIQSQLDAPNRDYQAYLKSIEEW
jgi:hypothetical protein